MFGISSKTLDEYITSEKDVAKKVSRVPGPQFIIAEREKMHGDEDEDDDEMWGDDWVVIDTGRQPKQESFTAAEAQDRIQRETLTMHSSKSTCVLQPKNNSSEQVNLEDFIIKKVIDKGSFGKVFLVENQKTGKVFAMKRLNKDVILQKNQVENIKVEKEILF